MKNRKTIFGTIIFLFTIAGIYNILNVSAFTDDNYNDDSIYAFTDYFTIEIDESLPYDNGYSPHKNSFLNMNILTLIILVIIIAIIIYLIIILIRVSIRKRLQKK